jgi:hypothetical protein
MNRIRLHMRAGAIWGVIALGSVVAGWSDSRAGAAVAYSIDFHTISAGASTLRNSCFVLSGTVAQAAPGYSSVNSGVPTYAVYAGFWSAAPAVGLDAIFFTGFEGC